MGNLDIEKLRPRIDIDGSFVDFAELRRALSVKLVAEDTGVDFTEPNYEGEIRGRCPACKRARSLSVSLNTNRFNCFSKGCRVKGGGVIDYFSKLKNVSAKEASHLLACAYRLGPYTDAADEGPNQKPVADKETGDSSNGKTVFEESLTSENITRQEFQELLGRFDRLSNIVWGHMLECERAGGIADEYDPPLTTHHITGEIRL